jgi:hypothetical protein
MNKEVSLKMWFGSFMIIAGTIICIAVGPSGVAKACSIVSL